MLILANTTQSRTKVITVLMFVIMRDHVTRYNCRVIDMVFHSFNSQNGILKLR